MGKVKRSMREIREMSREEALKTLREVEQLLMKERAQAARGAAPSSPKIIRELKKNRARLKHFLAQHEVTRTR